MDSVVAQARPEAEDRFDTARITAAVDALAVEKRSRAALRGEKFVGQWHINYAGNQFVAARQRQRDIEHGEAVRKVGGAVQRVYKPTVFGWRIMPAALFGQP